tara:strand:+ start:1794 stop:3608 length:1815 start_codon:yes stop_codon:yes gene_type:complete
MNVAAEAELLELKAGGFDAILNNSEMGIAILDDALKYRQVNRVLAEFNGISPEQHLDRTIWDVLPQLAPVVAPALQNVLDTGVAVLDLKVSANTPSIEGRESHWEASYLPIVNTEGNTVGILAIAQNRTFEYQLDRAKKDSYDLVQRILDSLFTFVGILTPEGVLVDANRAPLEAAGVNLQDVVGKRFWDCVWWNYSPQAQQHLKKAIEQAAQGQTLRFDVTNRIVGDTRITVDFMLSPLTDDHGEVTHLIASANDVSQRKNRETELTYSEERFRRVFDSTADGLLMIDDDGKIILANHSVAKMFGYTHKEMYRCTVEDLVPEHIRPQHKSDRKKYQSAPQARSMGAMRELYAKRKDGSQFPVEIALTPLQFPEGVRILATVVDISIQKDIQSSLMNALAEKTSLLNEVHHRVKNNLQVVSSLLSLQSRAVPDELRPYFKDSRDRIKAMALIHQQLYEQKDHEHVNAAKYSGNLISLIRRSYTESQKRITIDFNSQDSSVNLTLDQALPFGLLLNELLANAIKHAFKGMNSGQVDVSLYQNDEHTTLNISDNGCGIPDDVTMGKTHSLGFQLIPGLIDQLGATLNINNDNGASFEIKFATEVYN